MTHHAVSVESALLELAEARTSEAAAWTEAAAAWNEVAAARMEAARAHRRLVAWATVVVIVTLAAGAALALAACDGASFTEPGDRVPVATKHGTVQVDRAADPDAVRRYIEAGFLRARTRTRTPSRLDALTVDGMSVAVAPVRTCVYSGPHLVLITDPSCLDHEMQHHLATLLHLSEECVRWQDHTFDSPHGAPCDLDGEWTR